MKKNIILIVMIIVLLISTVSAGCSKTESAAEPSIETSATAQQAKTEKTAEAEEEKSISTTESTEQERTTEASKLVEEETEYTVSSTVETTEATESASKPVQSTSVAQKATETTKATSADDKKTDTEVSVKEPTKEPTQQTSNTVVTETKATEAKKICYITVDGYCSDKQIEINGGESVYDILKKSGADISARNTGYGIYIEGINGRFEFDEGPTSGWIYTVNGTRPSVSCSGYDVKSGDKIVWTYVTDI